MHTQNLQFITTNFLNTYNTSQRAGKEHEIDKKEGEELGHCGSGHGQPEWGQQVAGGTQGGAQEKGFIFGTSGARMRSVLLMEGNSQGVLTRSIGTAHSISWVLKSTLGSTMRQPQTSHSRLL